MIARVLLALGLLLVLGLGLWAELQDRWQRPLGIPPEGYRLVVAEGESLSAVARGLADAGIVHYPRLLRAYGRWSGLDQQIKRGEYRLAPGIDAEQLLRLLQEGRVIQYQVTLPEGITVARALQLLRAHGSLATELSGPEDPRLTALAEPHASIEGLLFPDSYRFERGASDWQILQRARRAMQSVLEEEWAQRDPGLPYETPYEALIMASIIERETGLPEERPVIAGVFVRRLERNMRLQTDPTVIYGLGPEFDGNLTRAHLRDQANPYNSYRHRGLPPTPIALPGRAAIRAALHPEPGDALYFVARGDGGHVFTATLEAHQQAVRKYQLQRRADYRSTPEESR